MRSCRRLLIIIMLLVLLCPVSASARTFTDDNHIRWTIANKNEVQEILGEDQSYLYLDIDSSVYKLAKDFTGGLQSLTDEQQRVIREKNQPANIMQELSSPLIKIKDHFLCYGDKQILDIAVYQQKDADFYKKNPQMSREAMEFQVYTQVNKLGNQLFIIITHLAQAIPAPYSDYYCDLVYWRDNRAIHLAAFNKFRPQSINESDDGSLWLSGPQYNGRFLSENSLMLVDTTGGYKSINQILRNNDVKLLACQGKRVLIWAGTHKLYFEIDKKKYDKKNDRVLWLDAGGKIQARPEKITGYTNFYRTAEDQLYGISVDRKRIVNLSLKRDYTQESGVEYEKLAKLCDDSSNDGNQKSVPHRNDPDGSTWYINQQERIVHIVNGRKKIFSAGPELLLNCLRNIFVETSGRKWFISAAGIACYEPGDKTARYITPNLPAVVRKIDKQHLIVDANGQLWMFGEQILRLPYQATTVTTEFDALTNGFKPLQHSYMEWDNQVFFAYQKDNPDKSALLRIYSLNLNGTLQYNDYILSSPAQNLFVYDKCFFATVADGFCRIENHQAMEIRNSALCNMQHFPHFINSHYIIFPSDARIVAVEIIHKSP
ncbi:hypothetical protein [Syntrophomonas palmitatica]|uniref:hypothetical protein n=1 Tax=Syntrophomonas palmitatica TaxID=402877 RepID=UPI0006D1EE89|nr:hypothetical protein [Syntrophomonas palmitatica]